MGGPLSNLKPWPKGVSGNPHGPNALPAEIRAERRKNRGALIKLIAECFARAPDAEDQPETKLEAAVLGVMKRAQEGEVRALEYLIDMVCGRIPETDPESPAEQMTLEEKIEALKRATALLEEHRRAIE